MACETVSGLTDFVRRCEADFLIVQAQKKTAARTERPLFFAAGDYWAEYPAILSI